MRPGTVSPVVAGMLWVLLVGATLFLAPPIREDASTWALALATGAWEGENPLTIAHFNLMGLWPIAIAMLLVDELRPEEGVPAWPFVVLMMVGGAFVMLPWFFLRKARPRRERGAPERLLMQPAAIVGVATAATFLSLWGLVAGDVFSWEIGRATEGFLYIMTLDYGVLWLLSLLIAREQGEAIGDIRWRFTGLPLVGSLIWVWLRESAASESSGR
jgi:hypothetical protein